MKQQTLLLATGNMGKAKEMKQFLADLPFKIITVEDLDTLTEEPEETGDTLEQNAMLKARYYAEQSGFLALADDSGFFIEALDGWPGIKAARVADTPDNRCNTILEKMKEQENRSAQYRTVMALYDPKDESIYTTAGVMDLNISTRFSGERKQGHGYDPILVLASTGEILDDMTTVRKNAVSSRGNALIKMKRFIHNQFRGKHFVVPIAFIVKDGLLLLNKRNDPHNQKYHGIWEFPGGSVEMGESVEDAAIKECQEETGFEVEIIAQLSGPQVKTFEYDSGPCQFYIIPYLCKVIGGQLNPSDEEVLEAEWMNYDDALSRKKFPGDTELMTMVKPLFDSLVAEHNL